MDAATVGGIRNRLTLFGQPVRPSAAGWAVKGE